MSSTTENKCMKLKVVCVGDGGVGKSAFLKKLRTGKFEHKYTPTLGVEVRTYKYKTTKGHVSFHVWDTAGKEEFRGLGRCYYFEAKYFLVFFDHTNQKSFSNVSTHVDQINEIVPNAVITLVSTKSDLRPTNVNTSTLSYWLRTHPGVRYIVTSSKNNMNMMEPFMHILEQEYGEDIELC